MAQESYPFDNGDVLEGAWSRMARRWVRTGVAAVPGSTPLQVFASTSGLQVFLPPGEAAVRGHHYRNTAQLAVAISANPAGSSRIDVVVLKLDPAANSVVAFVHEGTPGLGRPGLTQTDEAVYEMPLAEVTVGSGVTNIVPAAVTADLRPFMPADVLPVSVVADIPAGDLFANLLAMEFSTGTLKRYSGSAWQRLNDTPAGVTAPFAGASAPVGWLLADGSAVSRATYADLFAVIGITYGAGDTTTTFNLPNLKGKVAVGRDAAQTEFDTLGEGGGTKTHTLSTGEMPSHGHGASSDGEGQEHVHNVAGNTGGHSVDHSHAIAMSDSGGLGGGGTLVRKGGTGSNQTAGASVDHSHAFNVSSGGRSAVHNHTINISASGGGGAHNNLQPYIVLNHIIKV